MDAHLFFPSFKLDDRSCSFLLSSFSFLFVGKKKIHRERERFWRERERGLIFWTTIKRRKENVFSRHFPEQAINLIIKKIFSLFFFLATYCSLQFFSLHHSSFYPKERNFVTTVIPFTQIWLEKPFLPLFFFLSPSISIFLFSSLWYFLTFFNSLIFVMKKKREEENDHERKRKLLPFPLFLSLSLLRYFLREK